jgi:hypothetical protein
LYIPPPGFRNAFEERAATTHVYFVEGAGLIKIGFATSAIRRFYSMLTSCPIPLSLLASMYGGPTVENELHRRFACDRAHGEWFHCSPDLAAIIAAAPNQYGPEYQNCLPVYRKNDKRNRPEGEEDAPADMTDRDKILSRARASGWLDYPRPKWI